MSLFPRTPRLDGADTAAVRRALRHYFLATFDRYESLFETLASEEAYVRKPIALRHPLIFYFGIVEIGQEVFGDWRCCTSSVHLLPLRTLSTTSSSPITPT